MANRAEQMSVLQEDSKNSKYETTMKVAIILTIAMVVLVSAKPADDNVFKILRSEFDKTPDGAYRYSLETENHIALDQVGELKNVKDAEGHEQSVVVIHGSYSYDDPEGKKIAVNYVADEFGFRPEGEHIPKA